MSKIKGQYYRYNGQYLIRLYCIECGGELIYKNKVKSKFNHECKKCDSGEITIVKYPYWHKSEFGVKQKKK